jgi:acyl-CoA synthetase
LSDQNRAAIATLTFGHAGRPDVDRRDETADTHRDPISRTVPMTSRILSLLSAEAIEAFYRKGHWRNETIYDVALAHARSSPDRCAVRDRLRRVTFRRLVEAADAFAADLSQRGIRCGDRIALWMPDRIESVVALLACSRNGLVCCPSPHRNHTTAEVFALAERMRAAAFLYETGFGADADRSDIETELRGTGWHRHFYRLPPAEAVGTAFAGVVSSDTVGVSGPPPMTDPDRVIYLAFTSGSTGQPKGVMHSDNTLLVAPRAIARDWRIGADSVVYSLSPFSHNLGIGALLTALVGGAEFVVHDLHRRESLVDRLVETRTSYLVGVPTHAIDLLAEMRGRNLTKLGRVEGFRVSGAAAPPHVFAHLLRCGVVPQSGYGMTETNAHQYTLPDDDPSLIIGTCGRACAGYEIGIWDEDDPDVALPPGRTGVVGGRGACLMLGYFNDQIATESAFNAQGWFMTGDLGSIDENGYLRLTGRKKEVIIRGGHNINPARIEELAMKHEAVERAAAVAIADARLGERVCLAVKFRPGAKATAAEVLDSLAAVGLSKYEMPEFYLELLDIPLMSNGKIQKADIVAWIEEGRVAPVAVAATPSP